MPPRDRIWTQPSPEQILALGDPNIANMEDFPANIQPPNFPFVLRLRPGPTIPVDVFGSVVLTADWALAADESDLDYYNLVVYTITTMRTALRSAALATARLNNTIRVNPFMGNPDPLDRGGVLATTSHAVVIFDHTANMFARAEADIQDNNLSEGAAPLFGEVAFHVSLGDTWVQTSAREGHWVSSTGAIIEVAATGYTAEEMFGSWWGFDSTSGNPGRGLVGVPMSSLPFPSTIEEERAAAEEMGAEFVEWSGGEREEGGQGEGEAGGVGRGVGT